MELFDLNNDVELKNAIERYGKDTIAQFAFELVGKDAIASQNLINSLEFELSWAVNQIVISIYGESYFKFIDEGTKGGKTPPINKIIEWTKFKNIDTKLAFPIAKKIGRFGIAPRNILIELSKEQELNIVGKLESDIYNTFQKKLDEIIEK